VMNGYGNYGYPSMPVISADEYNPTAGEFDSCSLVNQQAMTWSRSFDTGDEFPDWDLPYGTVASANNVLSALSNISQKGQSARWQGIANCAHWYRGFAFYALAHVFAPPYDSANARSTWGIPLPLSPGRNQKIVRATVQQTYDQILSDLQAARNVPPKDDNWRPTRPSRTAVYAMFARTYLSMRKYRQALLYADSAIQQQPDLMHFDTIPSDRIFSFYRWNPEVIFSAAYYPSGPAAILHSHIDRDIYASYRSGDLRKDLYFKFGDFYFGTFDEAGYCFTGLAVDEVYLDLSECEARLGNTTAAMADLNYLLQSRWANGAFTPYTAADADDALTQILAERKKELVFRGLRWTDLRRLNLDKKTQQSISRTINGITYTLPPNDPRWTLPIPGYVLDFNPGMPQNIR